MVHYKHRYKTILTFHRRVINFLDGFERIACKRHPLLHQILFSRARQTHRLTGISCAALKLIVGLFLGYVLHYLFIGRLDAHPTVPSHRHIRLSMVWIIALAYVRSVKVRAIVCLIMPKMESTKIIYLFFTLIKIINLAFAPLMINVRRLFLTFVCFFGFRICERYQRFSLTFIEPLKLIAHNIFYNDQGPQELGQAIDMQAKMSDLNIQSFLDKIVQLYEKLTWPDAALTMLRSSCMYGLFDLLPSGMPVIDWVVATKDWFCDRYVDAIAPILRVFQPASAIRHNVTRIYSMLDQIMVNSTEQLKMILDAKRNIAKNKKLTVLTSRFNDLEAFEMSELLSSEAGTQLEETIGFVHYILQCLILVILVVCVIRAVGHHGNYLESLEYCNNYINRYFHHIDDRRKKAGKWIRILPLNGLDQEHLTPLYSVTLSPYEKARECITGKTLIFLCLLCLLPIYANLFVVIYMQTINERLVGIYKQQIWHRFKPQVNGSHLVGPVAVLLEWLNFDVKQHFEFDLSKCVNPAEEMQTKQWMDLVAYYAFLIAISACSSYMVRACSIICDYFYPRHGKLRILALYNERLGKRKDYIAKKVDTIKLLLESNRVYLDGDFDQVYKMRQRKRSASMPRVVGFLKGLSDAFAAKKCFVCYGTIRVPYLVCDKPRCAILYCQQCSIDMASKCLACGNKLGREIILV